MRTVRAEFVHVHLLTKVGTAYRIRTDDLRLERAVSWASRRMRHGRAEGRSTSGQGGILAAARAEPVRGGAPRGTPGSRPRPACSRPRRGSGRSANAPRTV